jgi:hypothetical protein
MLTSPGAHRAALVGWEEAMKARMFRLALSLSTLAMLIEVTGAGKKWG